MLSDLGLLPSRTEYLPLSVSFWMKIPNKQEVLQDWTQEGPHGYKWIWGLLKVQKMAPFLVKKVNKKKESNRGWGASRGVQEKLGDPGVSYREAKETTDGTEKPHLSHSFQLLAAFLLVENDWSEFYSFFNKDSHVVGKPWTWVGNLRAKSCCDYVSESSWVRWGGGPGGRQEQAGRGSRGLLVWQGRTGECHQWGRWAVGAYMKGHLGQARWQQGLLRLPAQGNYYLGCSAKLGMNPGDSVRWGILVF